MRLPLSAATEHRLREIARIGPRPARISSWNPLKARLSVRRLLEDQRRILTRVTLARADKLRPAQAESREQAPRRQHNLSRFAARKITR